MSRLPSTSPPGSVPVPDSLAPPSGHITTTPANEVDTGLLAGQETEFRSETIYFLVLDRFDAGSPGKNREEDEMYDPEHRDWHKYWGGDLQGVRNRLDYLRGFGISAIWTTPLFEQVQSMTVEEPKRAPIHGYWTSDFKRINPRWMNDPSEKRLFSRDDTVFDALIADMHSRDMKFILDIVCNHSSPETEQGKGRLFDDGRLVADFDNDVDNWYHHYGTTTDWTDEWQVQNCELGGLATFNENNILYRNYIKEAISLWVRKGVDALRIDTVKHMPLWFWQEFLHDVSRENPNLFRFGEWIDSHPADPRPVEFANRSGMSLLDFGFCHAVRDCLTGRDGAGFERLQEILDLDGNYSGATELVTFFENHDMPRLQSLGVSDRILELAIVLLMTSRGIPCLYYGCEQYLHDDTDGGDDPYNRPAMQNWDETPAMGIIRQLAAERRFNAAVQWGGQWPKWVEADTYVFLRRYRDYRCLVAVNRGPERELAVPNAELPDGGYRCILTGAPVIVAEGTARLTLSEGGYAVVAQRGRPVRARLLIRVQINGAPTLPGDRLVVTGDCEELGEWDLRRCLDLECVNANTWFGEIPFEQSAGGVVGYKYVILRAGEDGAPVRENRVVRCRVLATEGTAKWRDRWEE